MSGQFTPVLTLPVVATAALVAETFVTATGTTAAANGNALGVARSPAAIGQTAPVDVLGTAIVVAGAAIAAGAQVGCDASGRAVTYSTGAILGRTLQAASGLGDRVEVLLIPN